MKRQIINILIIIIILISIWAIYQIGFTAGSINGAVLSSKHYGKDFCVDFLNKTRSENGTCILKNDSKYNYRVLDCDWEKFQIIGEEEPTMQKKIIQKIERIMLYPIIKC